MQPNRVTFSLCEQRESNQRENTPGCVARPAAWCPALLALSGSRRSTSCRAPLSAPSMAIRPRYGCDARPRNGDNIKTSRQSRESGARQRALVDAFCVAEHRRDCQVERHGCRESLAGPGMAHRGGPYNTEKHRVSAAGRPRIGWPFFWFRLFWPIKKDEHGGAAGPYVSLRGKRK